MLATITRQVALEQLDIEHNAVRQLIDKLSREEMTFPDTIEYGLYSDQHLSFKDLLAHLITYEVFSVEAVEDWKQGKKHFSVDDMQSSSASRRIHYKGIEDRQNMSLDEVLDEWERTQIALMETILSLTDADWRSPASFPTTDAMDLGGILEIILVAPPRPPYRHLPVHIPDSQAYIKKLHKITSRK